MADPAEGLEGTTELDATVSTSLPTLPPSKMSPQTVSVRASPAVPHFHAVRLVAARILSSATGQQLASLAILGGDCLPKGGAKLPATRLRQLVRTQRSFGVTSERAR
jgi:hypothetical protein